MVVFWVCKVISMHNMSLSSLYSYNCNIYQLWVKTFLRCLHFVDYGRDSRSRNWQLQFSWNCSKGGWKKTQKWGSPKWILRDKAFENFLWPSHLDKKADTHQTFSIWQSLQDKSDNHNWGYWGFCGSTIFNFPVGNLRWDLCHHLYNLFQTFPWKQKIWAKFFTKCENCQKLRMFRRQFSPEMWSIEKRCFKF